MSEDFKMLSDKAAMALFDEAVKKFKGQSDSLESAIGAYMFGRHIGWKPLLLIHDKKTLKKYEKILGVNFREHMPDIGPLANKSIAYRAVQKVGNFWKAVSGEIKGIRSNEIDNSKKG